MKNLLFFSVLVFCLSFTLQAAEPLKYGIVGGMNVSNYSSSLFSSKIGFHIGGKCEMDLSQLLKGTYVEGGILLSLKGAKLDWGELGKMSMNPYYLEFPISMVYKYSVNKDMKISGKLGPYFGYGLFGKQKWSEGAFSDSGSADLFKGEEGIKRFDTGIGLFIGAEFQDKYQIYIGNEWGLTSINKDNSSEGIDLANNLKNKNFTIALSYLF